MQNTAFMSEWIDRLMESLKDQIVTAMRGSLKQLYEQELDTGKINVKLTITLEDKEVADPTTAHINGTRTITVPKVDFSIVRQVVLKEETKDTVEGTGYEVIFDTYGNARIERVHLAQTTFLNEDSAENWGMRADKNGKEIAYNPDDEVELEEDQEQEFEPDAEAADDVDAVPEFDPDEGEEFSPDEFAADEHFDAGDDEEEF